MLVGVPTLTGFRRIQRVGRLGCALLVAFSLCIASVICPQPFASAIGTNGLTAGEQDKGPVNLPHDYVYDPQGKYKQPNDDLGLYSARHDWCTSPVDVFLAAFRGPCAQHDICYDANPNAIPYQKSTGKIYCDWQFHRDLYANCHAQLLPYSFEMRVCERLADIYALMVILFGGFSGDPKPPKR